VPSSVMRVMTIGFPIFQLRKGELGTSVFDPDSVSPPLSAEEILVNFRAGSEIAVRTIEEVQSLNLVIEVVEGASELPMRLREAHREIRPATNMTRGEFKAALKELE